MNTDKKFLDEAAQDQFWHYTRQRRWFNGSLLVRRNFDGHIVSMQQSGSHWLKNMLAETMAETYNLPPMRHIQDDSIIGHTHSLPIYPNIPCIVHSHGYPHVATLRLSFLHYPRYLVLVRGLKESLVAHYERFKGSYEGASFSTYLRGDLHQKKFFSDIYSRIRFMNEWGDVCARAPEKATWVRYEDMQADAGAVLKKAWSFFQLPAVTEDVIMRSVASNTKNNMAKKPTNPLVTTQVVRVDHQPLDSYFDGDNEEFFQAACCTYLRHDFGYKIYGN